MPIEAWMSGLEACLRKQPFTTPTANQHKRNRAHCKRPRRGHDTLTEGSELLDKPSPSCSAPISSLHARHNG
jgi:hypothetical protein